MRTGSHDDTRPNVCASLRRVREIADGPVAASADEVDRAARFPHEAIAALREECLLGALAPPSLGGAGVSYSTAGLITEILASRCASTAMIYAMHQIQMSCLIRHGRSVALHDFIRQVAHEQLLLASATTEEGTGGDIRISSCALSVNRGRFLLEKRAPVISYGAYAQAILATARSSQISPASDEVLVVCRQDEMLLTQKGVWDTLGLRGTCGPGFLLRAEGPAELIFDDSFAEILGQTMLPVSHTLWASVWLGIASAAVTKARQYVQDRSRKAHDATTPSAFRLATIFAKFEQFRALVRAAAARLDESPREELASTEAIIAMNNLKTSAAALVTEIVGQAMVIVGIAGYREGGEYSMGRLLRDAYSASVMINDDRIMANTARLLFIHRESLI